MLISPGLDVQRSREEPVATLQGLRKNTRFLGAKFSGRSERAYFAADPRPWLGTISTGDRA